MLLLCEKENRNIVNDLLISEDEGTEGGTERGTEGERNHRVFQSYYQKSIGGIDPPLGQIGLMLHLQLNNPFS